MPFFVAESNLDGTMNSGTTQQLLIAPTYVLYPDHFDNVIRTSRDGNTIVQTPSRDSRTRKWVWRNYKTIVPKYNQLFSQLLNYHYKLRIGASPPKAPWVYLQDTETLNLVTRTWNGTIWVETPTFFKAKVIQVTQNIAPQSGYPTYGETTFEFYIDDPSYFNW